MKVLKKKSIKQKKEEQSIIQQLEQNITDLEITVLELQQKKGD